MPDFGPLARLFGALTGATGTPYIQERRPNQKARLSRVLFESLVCEKEMLLTTKGKQISANDAKIRAEANFKKEERAREGAQAMIEYQQNAKLVRERMAQLRALRLAKVEAEKRRGG
jgi:hypothetical protein